jgi:O-antigen/teichoic acid export membrane protein
LLLRLVLVVGWGMGVLGVVLADLLVTIAFTILLVRLFVPIVGVRFSWTVLGEALRFGLPRVPHGCAHQIIAVGDRYLLSRFVGLADLGIYSIGASFGLALKLFLSAFEYAWAPFYYSIALQQADAPATFSKVTTYTVAALIWMVAGLSAVAHDLVRLMTKPSFYEAASVIPWVALGVLMQGIYLLTSIGLNITKQGAYYPLSTGIAAATSLAANLLLIPRFGVVGAAWSNALSYGVLAAVAMRFSQRFYPIQYEYGRLAVAAGAGGIAYLGARLLGPASGPIVVRLLIHAVIVAVGFPVLLYVFRFFEAGEIARLQPLLTGLRRFRRAQAAESSELGGEIVETPVPESVPDSDNSAVTSPPAGVPSQRRI